MYKILQSTDWSFLIGGEVIQVAIGLHDVQVALFKNKLVKDLLVSIWCDSTHNVPGGSYQRLPKCMSRLRRL